jgi:hypothetical protein
VHIRHQVVSDLQSQVSRIHAAVMFHKEKEWIQGAHSSKQACLRVSSLAGSPMLRSTYSLPRWRL